MDIPFKDLEAEGIQTTSRVTEIKSYEDAMNMYETMESKRLQLETTLQIALAQVRKAMKEVQIVEDQLFEADLEAGRARNAIKNSGFGDVLLQKNCSGILITESNGRCFATVPGGPEFSIVLD